MFRNGDELLVEPNVIVPVPVGRFKVVGGKAGSSPWIVNGQEWHLDKRCSTKTREMLLALDKLLQENFELEGPRWGQKHYVAYRRNNFNWLAVGTKPSALVLDLHVKPKSFAAKALAAQLGVVEFDRDESLSEKLGLPSSVAVLSLRETRDRIRPRAKDDFDLSSEAFLSFLNAAYKACAK